MDATIAPHPKSPATSDFAEVHDPAAHLPSGAGAAASAPSPNLATPTTADLTLESAQALARALPDVVPSAHPSPVPSVSTWSSHADSHIDGDLQSRSVSPTLEVPALPMYGFAPIEPTTPTPTRAVADDVPASDRFRSATSAFSSSVKALVSSIIDPVPADQAGSSLPSFFRRASTSSGESGGGSPQQATPRPALAARPLDVTMFDLIEQLTVMFPGVDRVVIEAVVESHGGDVDRAIPALLEISDPDYRPVSPVDTPTVTTTETLAHFMASPGRSGISIEFHRPKKTTPVLEKVYALVRKEVKSFDVDRFMAPDIDAVWKLIRSGAIWNAVAKDLGEEPVPAPVFEDLPGDHF
ncbi:hypothetical protein AMAG_18589 [Allomyces macrogynus ATCC 38327]|uniref:CUE domain-containing protein n=1 Tax=Allomyces macrogynus (strain ATCC 38327) TaxID=578462 RepID=A0A0L0SE21_ALLM3|nr:hypothetical protein AMAG_18589 [Allomyces macrogynus ATCC 38327]|eukprot:KNE60682.1 hypothetical protein AMAG_18589 [Allomyces macrogynus ATCC 38327]